MAGLLVAFEREVDFLDAVALGAGAKLGFGSRRDVKFIEKDRHDSLGLAGRVHFLRRRDRRRGSAGVTGGADKANGVNVQRSALTGHGKVGGAQRIDGMALRVFDDDVEGG